jgi:hypothetical protein
MRNPLPPRPHTSAAITGRRSAAGTSPRVRRLRPELLSDAVIAGYIHDISARHRRRRTGWSVTTVPAAEPAR